MAKTTNKPTANNVAQATPEINPESKDTNLVADPVPALTEQEAAKSGQEQKPPTPKLPKDPYQELATKYAKSYPKNNTFHITSDMQVFLDNDKSLALLHQRTLNNEEQVRTIKIK